VTLVERVLAPVRRERQVVQGVLGTTADDGARSGRELQPHLSRHVVLRGVHVRVDRLPERAEPQAVVHELAPALLEAGLVVRDLALEGQILQRAVRRDEGERAGHLVQLSALDAHPAVLEHVDPPEPVPAAERVDRSDQVRERPRRPVERHGHAPLERDDDLRGLHRAVLRRRRALERALGRRDPRILERPALGGSAPQVLVDRVRGRDGRDRDAPFGGERDRLLARDPRIADRREDPQVRREHAERHLEPHLVVPLSGAAVRHDPGADLARGPDHLVGDQRTRETAHHRVLALVQAVDLDRRGEELGGETVDGVDHPHARGAGELPRRRICPKSSCWPTSTATAWTSTPCSASQRIVTEVSSPPE
jgi:hypothetical protein